MIRRNEDDLFFNRRRETIQNEIEDDTTFVGCVLNVVLVTQIDQLTDCDVLLHLENSQNLLTLRLFVNLLFHFCLALLKFGERRRGCDAFFF